MRGPQTGRVRVVREADDRDLRVRVSDLFRIDSRDVRDHELGVRHVVGRDQMVTGQKRFELPPEEEIDACEQDRRHDAMSVTRCSARTKGPGP